MVVAMKWHADRSVWSTPNLESKFRLVVNQN